MITEAFRLINSLIQNDNSEVIAQLFIEVKKNPYVVFAILKRRIDTCIEQLLVMYDKQKIEIDKTRSNALKPDK